MRQFYILLIAFLSFGITLQAQNPCGDGKIIVNGQDVDAVLLENNNKQGVRLPFWLESGSTIAAGDRVQLVSVIEFNEEAQSNGGNTLIYNRVISVNTTPQTVPANKVWKVESIIKHSDPFSSGLIASSNHPICFGDNLNLTSSVAGVTYSWTGPGGFTSSAQNPTINNADFTNTGTYYLTATNQGCTYTDSVNVVVNPLPASTFTNTFAVENYASTFTPTVSGQSYSWTFPSGAPPTSTVENPQVTWTTNGSYNVDLTVTDGIGCSSSTQQSVSVSGCLTGQAQSNFSWSTATVGQATNFTPALTGETYAWTFDDTPTPGTSIQENASYTWNSPGTYQVTLTVYTNSGCYTEVQTVTVSNCQIGQPESDFSWSSPGTGQNITFTPNNMTADSYAWTFDQASSGTNNIQSPNDVVWSSVGNYDVTLLTTFNGLGCFTTTKNISIVNSMTYNYTGNMQTFNAQDGVTYLIECWGADGGDAYNGVTQTYGGVGGYATGDYSVGTPTTLNIYVGERGHEALPNLGSSNVGGGGGGMTDIITPGNTIVIVGGAGGGATSGTTTNECSTGGDGGGLIGGTAVDNSGVSGGSAATGGTQVAGGVGVAGIYGVGTPGGFGYGGGAANGGLDGTRHGAGGFGGYNGTGGWNGGGGGSNTTSGNNHSGGGGSGYYGGGGGRGDGGAGGGGSSYIGGVTNGTTAQAGDPSFVPNPDSSGNGHIIITW